MKAVRLSQIKRNWHLLTEREQMVIFLRYGLDRYPPEPRTLEQVGRLMPPSRLSRSGITREGVRQIEARAIKKIIGE